MGHQKSGEQMDFFNEYFVKPIFDRSGYNMVNTLAYAAIAIGALYAIYLGFSKMKIRLGKEFWAALLLFVVFGSSVRVVTDSIDSGAMKAFTDANCGSSAAVMYDSILASHALDYGYWTVTPGIYIVTAALFLSAVLVGEALGRKWFAAVAGGALALFPIYILSPMMVNWAYAFGVLALAIAAALAAKFLLKFNEMKMLLPVFAHAFDGAATWIAIDWFGPANGVKYFEQHVISSAIGSASFAGFGLFFLLKAAFSSAAVYFITKEDGSEELPKDAAILALLAITVLGLAPGIRDMLRMLCGT